MMIRRLPALLALFAAFLSTPLHAEAPKADVKMGTYYGGKAAEYPDWFKNSFLNIKEDITDAHKSGKRVMLMFTHDNFPYCSALVERNLSQRQIEATLKEKFDVILINIWATAKWWDWTARPTPRNPTAPRRKSSSRPACFSSTKKATPSYG